MRQIIYVSSAAVPFGSGELRDLLRISVENNRRSGISGMLLFHDGNFIQAIEGPEPAVQALFDKIAADRRHGTVIVLEDRTVGERSFGEWSMGFREIDDAQLTQDVGFTDYLARIESEPKSAADIAWLLLDTYKRNLR